MTDYTVSLVYNTDGSTTQIEIDNDEGKTEWLWKNDFTFAVNQKMWQMIVQVVKWLAAEEDIE